MHVKNQAAEQQLREEFKKINWWARNQSFEILILLLHASALFSWLLSNDINEVAKQHPGTPVVVIYLFFASIIVFVTVSCVLRYFFGEVPWQKYKKLHMPPEQEDEDDLSMSG